MLSIKANFNMFKRIDKSSVMIGLVDTNVSPLPLPRNIINNQFAGVMTSAKFNSQDGTGTFFGPASIASELFDYQKDTNYILTYFNYITGYNLEPGVRRFMPDNDYFDFLFSHHYYKYGRTRKTQKKNFELEKLAIIDHIGMTGLYYTSQTFQEIVFLEDGYVLHVRQKDMRIVKDFKMRCILKIR